MKMIWLVTTLFSLAASAAEIPKRFELPQSTGEARDSRFVTVCTIQQNFCLKYSQFNGQFPDGDVSANVDSRRCMQRAREYSQVCANPQGVMTTATFSYPSGKSVSTTFRATGSVCEITQNTCELYPHMTGTFLDLAPTVETNPARCMERAREFSLACGNTSGVVTTARFTYPNGQPVSNYYTGQSSCTIQQSVCQNHPEMAGIFADAADNADASQPRCHLRAQEYAQWCGNPCGSLTIATFTNMWGATASKYYVVP